MKNIQRTITKDSRRSHLRSKYQQAALFASVLSVLSIASVPTLAADQKNIREDNPRYEKFQKGEHIRKNGGKKMRRMINALDLTESQIDLLTLSYKQPSENREQIQSLRKQLNELTRSSSYSESDAENIIEQINDLSKVDMVSKANAKNAFYISLSEEQLSTLKTMQEKRAERRQDRQEQKR